VGRREKAEFVVLTSLFHLGAKTSNIQKLFHSTPDHCKSYKMSKHFSILRFKPNSRS
jgi:hypothetical protein